MSVQDALRSRGLHYGDGVFRTLLLAGGSPVDLDAQVAKLRADGACLGLVLPSEARLRVSLRAAARGHRQGVLKILAWRRGIARGYAPRDAGCVVRILRYALPRYPAHNWARGVSAGRSPVVLSEQALLAGVKHLNRMDQVLASRDWPSGVSEMIVCDARGRPVGGTRSNLFWVSRGRLCTPALQTCGVAGRMRERVLAHAAALGLGVSVRSFSWDALASAEEIFVTNSVIGMWSVRSLGGRRRYVRGEVSRSVEHLLQHPFRGSGS